MTPATWQTSLLKQRQERKVSQEEMVLPRQGQRGFPWCPVDSRPAHLPRERQIEKEWGKPLFDEPPARTEDSNQVSDTVSPLNSYTSPSSNCPRLPEDSGQEEEKPGILSLPLKNSEQRLQSHCLPQTLQLNLDLNKYSLMTWLWNDIANIMRKYSRTSWSFSLCSSYKLRTWNSNS